MIQWIKIAAVSFITLFLTSTFNNKIRVSEEVVIPSLGKILHPFTGLWNSRYDDSSIHHDIEGRDGKIEIVYDERAVPHIFASTLGDALFAQGYVEASDRLFQMDLSTRAADGRLSEILGHKMIRKDMEKRRFGLPHAARNAVVGWKKFPEKLKLVKSYGEGINYFINNLEPKDYPIEYKLIECEPEEWSLYKSALFLKTMAEVLCSGEQDIASTNALNHFGRETFDYLYPEINKKESPVIPRGTAFNEIEPIAGLYPLPDKVNYDEFRTNQLDPGAGSNNWAVSGTKTKSGRPILCNDPHLKLTLPSIWYEIHIVTPDINAYGVTLPGMPGIMIGFNNHIAWGETNVGQDVLDYYQIKWTDESRKEYILDGDRFEVETVVEEYKVRNRRPVYDTIKYTTWGPVTRDESLAMRWLAHDVPDQPEFMTFIDAMEAKDYGDFLKATESFITPAQNFAFAAKDGDIALRVNGKFPKKLNQDGRFIKRGDTDDAGWQDFIDRENNPQTLNPERGFISSANQRSTDESYPYYYTGRFEDYRGRRVNELLEQADNIDIDQMMKMQNDDLSIKARDVLPLLLSAIAENEISSNGVYEVLKDWDFTYNEASIAPTYFNIWYRNFYRLVWDELYDIRKDKSILMPEGWRLAELMKEEPNSRFFDLESTPSTEDFQDIALVSFERSLDELKDLSDTGKGLEWGKYQPMNIMHYLEVPAFSEMNLAISGNEDVINACNAGWGPSWRMIVSLTDEIEAYGIYPGGQSGNPASPYYKNMIDQWSKGTYQKLNYIKSPDEIKEPIKILSF